MLVDAYQKTEIGDFEFAGYAACASCYRSSVRNSRNWNKKRQPTKQSDKSDGKTL